VDEFEQLGLDDGHIAAAAIIEAERLVLSRAADPWCLERVPATASVATAADDAWCKAVAAQPELLITEAWTRVIASLAQENDEFLGRFTSRLRQMPAFRAARAKAAPSQVESVPSSTSAAKSSADSDDDGDDRSEPPSPTSPQRLPAGPGSAKQPVWAMPAAHQKLCHAATCPSVMLRSQKLVHFHPEEDAALVLGFQEAAAASAFYHARIHSHRWCLYRATLLCRRLRVRASKLTSKELTRDRAKTTSRLYRKAKAMKSDDFRAVSLFSAIRAVHSSTALATMQPRLAAGLFGLPCIDLPLVMQGKSTIRAAGYKAMNTIIATMQGKRVRPSPRPSGGAGVAGASAEAGGERSRGAASSSSSSLASRSERVWHRLGFDAGAESRARTRITEQMHALSRTPGRLAGLVDIQHTVAFDLEAEIAARQRHQPQRAAGEGASDELASRAAMLFNPWAASLAPPGSTNPFLVPFNPLDAPLLMRAEMPVAVQPPRDVSSSLVHMPVPDDIKRTIGLPASVPVSVGSVVRSQALGLAALQAALTTACLAPAPIAPPYSGDCSLSCLPVLVAAVSLKPVENIRRPTLERALEAAAPAVAAAFARSKHVYTPLWECAIRAWEAAAVAQAQMDAETDVLEATVSTPHTVPAAGQPETSQWGPDEDVEARTLPRQPRKLLRLPATSRTCMDIGSEAAASPGSVPLVDDLEAFRASRASLRTTPIPILRGAASELHSLRPASAKADQDVRVVWMEGAARGAAGRLHSRLAKRMVAVVCMARALLSQCSQAFTHARREAMPNVVAVLAAKPAFCAENYSGFFRALGWGDIVDISHMIEAMAAENASTIAVFASRLTSMRSATPMHLETNMAGRAAHALRLLGEKLDRDNRALAAEQARQTRAGVRAGSVAPERPAAPVKHDREHDTAQQPSSKRPAGAQREDEGIRAAEAATTASAMQESRQRRRRVVIRFGARPESEQGGAQAPSAESSAPSATDEYVEI
jgi:hypothetical protein